MKNFTIILAVLIAIGIGASLGFHGRANASNIAPKEKQEHLLRIQAQLELLGVRFQAEYEKQAAPLLAEQNVVLNEVCGAAKIALPDCDVNRLTGVISKKPPPAAPQAKGK